MQFLVPKDYSFQRIHEAKWFADPKTRGHAHMCSNKGHAPNWIKKIACSDILAAVITIAPSQRVHKEELATLYSTINF